LTDPRRSRQISIMDEYESNLRTRIGELGGDIDMARELAQLGALASLQTTALRAERHLSEHVASVPEVVERAPLTEDEARDRLRIALAQLPPHERRDLVAAIAGPPALTVVGA